MRGHEFKTEMDTHGEKECPIVIILINYSLRHSGMVRSGTMRPGPGAFEHFEVNRGIWVHMRKNETGPRCSAWLKTHSKKKSYF